MSRESIVGYAHYAEAGGMFAMIALDVLINARTGPYRRLYAAILAAMALTQLIWLSWPAWAHAVLAVKASLISLFEVF